MAIYNYNRQLLTTNMPIGNFILKCPSITFFLANQTKPDTFLESYSLITTSPFFQRKIPTLWLLNIHRKYSDILWQNVLLFRLSLNNYLKWWITNGWICQVVDYHLLGGPASYGAQLFQPTATALALFTWFINRKMAPFHSKRFNSACIWKAKNKLSESSQKQIRCGGIFFAFNLNFQKVSIKDIAKA